jgi:hypothetical protein
MKKPLFLSVILAVTCSLQAQEAIPVVIVNTTGKVTLISQNESKPTRIESGAVAKSTGQLQLSKNSTATVYCSGTFKQVIGKQTIPLANLCGTASARRSLNFDGDFGKAVMAAVEVVAVAQSRGDGWAAALGDKPKTGDGWGRVLGDKPKTGDGWGRVLGDKPKTGDGWGRVLGDKPKTGDGWGKVLGDKPKTGDGWGGRGTNIYLILPFGKVSADNTTFSWSKPAGTNTYQLVILDEGRMVHSLSTKDTFARVNLQSLNLSVGKTYRWKVSTAGDQPLNSDELEFGIGTNEERMAAISDASSSNVYKSINSKSVQGITEALALETGDWYYDAQQKYAQLQKKNADNMVRMMHAAFWMRYGFPFLAQKAAAG